MESRREPPAALAEVVTAATGREVTSISTVRGGDTSAAYRMEFFDGGAVFAKTHPAPPPNFFTTEAWGLRWMREPGVIEVPEVISVSDGTDEVPAHLVLEWVHVGGAPRTEELMFGRQLAALHQAGAPCFGRTDRRTTGSLALPNEPCATWAEFYGTQRLLPLAARARARRALSEPVIARIERLAERLERFDDGSPPARLHGDLWLGNRLVDRYGTCWLIDPACHGGHPEFDLAMMRLFGGFGVDAFAYYDVHAPLADGWEERVQLHQLAPLVVHAIKFGGPYVDAVASALARYS